jgi:hypothetical protein
MDVVSLLEANWTSIQEIVELASRVLTGFSSGCGPSKRLALKMLT